MRCCFTACELWKLARRGYVPMDIYKARSCSNGCGCGCGSTVAEASIGCGCSNGTVEISSGCTENNCCNNCDCD